MKRSILVLLALLVTSPCFAADTKTSALTELATTPAGTDELYINDGGTSKKITYTNLISGAGDIVTIGDVTSGAAFNGTAGTKITGLTTSNLEIETANTLNFDTGADGNNFTIQSDGNVGIGVSAPTVSLQVNGTVRGSNTNGKYIGIGGIPDGNDGIALINSTTGDYLNIAQGALVNKGNTTIQASNGGGANDLMHLYHFNEPAFSVLHEGNVGIATSAPSAKLHVIQTGAADAFRVDDQTSDTTPFVINEDGNVGIGTTILVDALTVGGNISFRKSGETTIARGLRITPGAHDEDTVLRAYGSSGSLLLQGFQTSSGRTQSEMKFSPAGFVIISTGPASTNQIPRLTVDSAGNVGIGDTTPDHILEIMNGIYASATRDTQLTISNTNASYDPQIGFELVDGTNTFTIGVDDSASNQLIIAGADIGAGSDYVAILTNGNVGIGTTAPSQLLDVVGNVEAQGVIITGATIQFSSLDCTGNTNGGALTADASGNVTCSDDDGGAGSSLLTDDGAITYLTSTTDDFGIGGTDATAVFHVDAGTSTVTVNGTLSVTGSGGGELVLDELTTFTATAADKHALAVKDDGGYYKPESDGTEIKLWDETSGIVLQSGTAPTVDTAGEVGIDTTDDQFLYYGSALRVIPYEYAHTITIENLAAADDNMLIMTPIDAITITKVGATYVGTGNTVASISLEDCSGNAMTHTAPTAVAHGTNVTFQSVTANNTLAAGECVRFDVDNAVAPETDTYSITVGYTRDRQ